MSKRGKKQNRIRKAQRPAQEPPLPIWQASTLPLQEHHIPEVLADPLRLFVLDAKDEVRPVHQAFPGALGMMFINCLHGQDTHVFSNGEPITFRKGNDNGWVHVEFVGHDSHTPLLIAEELSPAMRVSLQEQAAKATETFTTEA